MKVALINGSPHEKGCTYTDMQEIAKALREQDVDSEIFWIGKEVYGCRACGSCREKHRCVIDGDLVNDLAARFDEFDGFVFGAPVYYSGAAASMCAFMDRFFYVNASKMAGKVTASVVNARRGGNSASFERLNQYALISNAVVVGSQYWNFTHGNKPEEVVRDEEGMQTLRTLAKNMAWLLKCIEAGKKAGVQMPEREAVVRTSFIR